MNKKMIFKAGMLLAAAIFTGCANDELAQKETTKTDSGEASQTLTPFASTENTAVPVRRAPMSRTSMQNHRYLTGGEFMWEPGDKIYVKDDDNTMQNSGSNSNITATQPTARFQLPGKYDGSTYEVYYTGTATTANASTVTIASSQTQAAPNDTKHFGASGDCGTATATRVGDHFEFMLDHKASYLCFLPRVMNAALAPNVYLTKIVVKSDNAIAGDYTLSLAGLGTTPTTNAATEITLTTQGAAHPNGFPLPTATNVATNAAYMVIAPGTHTLTVDYYIKDPVTNVEGAITKTLSATNFEANKVYDITANLTPTDYSDRKYYMWDAQQNYWYQHEWDTTDPWQPVINIENNSNFPQNNADIRWYNEASAPAMASQTCQACPNVNEASWYVMNGNLHWDSETMWSTMGHLYKAGVWIRKKDYIATFSTNTATDGLDHRTSSVVTDFTTSSIVQGKPSDTNMYFYLPALGQLNNGTQYEIGLKATCWTSSAPINDIGAYGMSISSTEAKVSTIYTRNGGLTLWELH